MPVIVLGISGYYHDAAAALVSDGTIVAAAQEERFSRKKHDPRFPARAINYCLEEAFIEPDELTAVVFYDHLAMTMDRAIQSLAHVAPRGREQWRQAAPALLGTKLHVARQVRETLGHDVPVYFTQHHLSHAASAFYPSPFERAAVLTMDGVGEWATTSIGLGDGDRVELLREIRYPHSLGLLYSAFTYFTGFKVNSGEYKLMGLAPYGRPVYADVIKEHLIDIKPDGSFRLHTDRFAFVDSNVMTGEAFVELFGGPPREPESRITRREMDLAASVQQVTEQVVLNLAAHARALTDSPNLVMAGGVALNCVANGKLLRAGIFDHLWIQPAAGDAGGALGAALLASHMKLGVRRVRNDSGRDSQRGSLLGPAFGSREIRALLDRFDRPYQHIDDVAERSALIARALADGNIIGLFSGRMEFGPRALGSRSILGNPMDADTQTVMNLKIKYRESFRPFAPSVLAARCRDYFELDCESPYMLLVAPVDAQRRLPMDLDQFDEDHDMLQVVRQPRSDIPAVTHVDYSARVQSVHPDDHPFYHAVIEAFERETGCGVIVNTSFNVRGEPIVCTPEDAYRCFMRTEMDMLVLGDCVLYKHAQPAWDEAPDAWKDEYELD